MAGVSPLAAAVARLGQALTWRRPAADTTAFTSVSRPLEEEEAGTPPVRAEDALGDVIRQDSVTAVVARQKENLDQVKALLAQVQDLLSSRLVDIAEANQARTQSASFTAQGSAATLRALQDQARDLKGHQDRLQATIRDTIEAAPSLSQMYKVATRYVQTAPRTTQLIRALLASGSTTGPTRFGPSPQQHHEDPVAWLSLVFETLRTDDRLKTGFMSAVFGTRSSAALGSLASRLAVALFDLSVEHVLRCGGLVLVYALVYPDSSPDLLAAAAGDPRLAWLFVPNGWQSGPSGAVPVLPTKATTFGLAALRSQVTDADARQLATVYLFGLDPASLSGTEGANDVRLVASELMDALARDAIDLSWLTDHAGCHSLDEDLYTRVLETWTRQAGGIEPTGPTWPTEPTEPTEPSGRTTVSEILPDGTVCASTLQASADLIRKAQDLLRAVELIDDTPLPPAQNLSPTDEDGPTAPEETLGGEEEEEEEGLGSRLIVPANAEMPLPPFPSGVSLDQIATAARDVIRPRLSQLTQTTTTTTTRPAAARGYYTQRKRGGGDLGSRLQRVAESLSSPSVMRIRRVM